jgi:hypothetical protein
MEYNVDTYNTVKELLYKIEQDMYGYGKVTDQMYNYQLICFLVKLDKRFQPYINKWFMLGLSHQLSNSI